LERSYFLVGCSFKIHGEPQYGDEYPSYTGGNVLSDFTTLFASKILDLNVVCFYFGHDHCTGSIGVCHLNGRNRLGITASACGRQRRNGYD
jgi:hypothetical protein